MRSHKLRTKFFLQNLIFHEVFHGCLEFLSKCSWSHILRHDSYLENWAFSSIFVSLCNFAATDAVVAVLINFRSNDVKNWVHFTGHHLSLHTTICRIQPLLLASGLYRATSLSLPPTNSNAWGMYGHLRGS